MTEEILLYEHTKKLPEIFQKEEVESMIKQIDQSTHYKGGELGHWLRARDQMLIITIYVLALRPNEACSLRFDDFDISNMTVKIRGETNKSHKDRVIPIPPQFFTYLRKYASFPRHRFWRGSQYLFPSLQSDHINAQTLKVIFREKVLKPMDVWIAPKSTVPPFRLYTLRHSRATEVLNKTHDIFAVANLLGHSSLNSTKIYLHKNSEYMEYLRNSLNI